MIEHRNGRKLGQIGTEILRHVEREIGIRIDKVMSKGINIEYISNTWWKCVMQYCVKHHIQMDIFKNLNSKCMVDTFMEKVMEEGCVKGELKVINYMRIQNNTWNGCKKEDWVQNVKLIDIWVERRIITKKINRL